MRKEKEENNDSVREKKKVETVFSSSFSISPLSRGFPSEVIGTKRIYENFCIFIAASEPSVEK